MACDYMVGSIAPKSRIIFNPAEYEQVAIGLPLLSALPRVRCSG